MDVRSEGSAVRARQGSQAQRKEGGLSSLLKSILPAGLTSGWGALDEGAGGKDDRGDKERIEAEGKREVISTSSPPQGRAAPMNDPSVKLTLTELGILLGAKESNRQDLRNLAYLERAIEKYGFRATYDVQLSLLKKASHELEILTEGMVISGGLELLKSRLEIVIRAREGVEKSVRGSLRQ